MELLGLDSGTLSWLILILFIVYLVSTTFID